MARHPSEAGFGWFLQEHKPWLFNSWKRLSITMLLLLFLPAVILLVVSSMIVKQRIEARGARELEMLSVLISKQVQEEFLDLRNYVESFASRPSLIAELQSGSPGLEQQMKTMVTNNFKLSRCVVVDADGTLISSYPTDPRVIGVGFAHREWFKEVSRSNEPIVSGVYKRAAMGGEDVVMIACKVRNGQGELLGYVGGQYLLSEMVQWLRRITAGQLDVIVLSDQYENALFDDQKLWQEMRGKEIRCSASDGPPGGTHLAKKVKFGQGEMEYLYDCAEVEGLSWKVLVLSPTRLVMGPLRDLQKIIGVFFGMFFLLSVVIGWLWRDCLKS